MSLPALLHQIWLGPKPIPERERQWCDAFQRTNPSWSCVVHTNEALQKYESDPYLRELQDRKESLAFIADRLRVLILRDQGGVYLDCDCQPLKPLNSLSHIWTDPRVTFVAGMRSPDRQAVALHRGVALIDNTFIASAPNSRMINRLVDLWSPKNVVCNGHDVGCQIMRHLDHDTVLLNYRYFYAENPMPESIVLHDSHNLASWVPEARKRNPAVMAHV